MFDQGFRPFFGLAALIAAMAIPLWLWLLDAGSTSLTERNDGAYAAQLARS
ncbi:MAG: hypothetical protein ACI9DC_000104 [Gammaproteobacteria bacterium]|jgi:uncharacterized protein involved in response to NO